MGGTVFFTSAADDTISCTVIALVGDESFFSFESAAKVARLGKIIHSGEGSGYTDLLRAGWQTFATGDTWNKVVGFVIGITHILLLIFFLYFITKEDVFQVEK